jgi:hypothetical protein
VHAKFAEGTFPDVGEQGLGMGFRMGGAAFAVFVGFLLDALVGHSEVGLPGHAVVVGYLPG